MSSVHQKVTNILVYVKPRQGQAVYRCDVVEAQDTALYTAQPGRPPDSMGLRGLKNRIGV